MGRKKMSDAARIRAFYEANPNVKPGEVAKRLRVKPASVYLVRQKMKATTIDIYKDEAAKIVGTLTTPTADPVNHPPHYKTGGIETIDFIEAKGLNYRLGNVVKYITRAEHKGNRKEDLEKALWYLQREIDKA